MYPLISFHPLTNDATSQVINLYFGGNGREKKAILFQKIQHLIDNTLWLALAEQRERLLTPSDN